jgi:hypothetical protein
MSTTPKTTALAPFLEHLFAFGEARLTGWPEVADVGRVHAVLRRAFREYRRSIAGGPIDFDADSALAAALFTARACWFAVSREEPAETVKAELEPLAAPSAPSSHLAVDLTLRYAVTVYRRVHAQSPDDPLATRLAKVLRRCPLTGVLSDVADAPLSEITFGGHPGLELLYAERLAANFRPAWLPGDGGLRDVAELVFRQQGKQWPPNS